MKTQTPEPLEFPDKNATRDCLRALRRRLLRAVPVRRAHPLLVNVSVVWWAGVEAVLSVPMWVAVVSLGAVALLLGGLERLVLDAAIVVDWVHARFGERAHRRKNRTHNAEMGRRVWRWVWAITEHDDTETDMRRGVHIGNGLCVRWPGGRSVVVMPGHHPVALFDSDGFLAACVEAEASQVAYLENIGHTPTCARRMAWFGGGCECEVYDEDYQSANRARTSQKENEE